MSGERLASFAREDNESAGCFARRLARTRLVVCMDCPWCVAGPRGEEAHAIAVQNSCMQYVVMRAILSILPATESSSANRSDALERFPDFFEMSRRRRDAIPFVANERNRRLHGRILAGRSIEEQTRFELFLFFFFFHFTALAIF